MMGINAVKGVEIARDSRPSSRRLGARRRADPARIPHEPCGGTLGGISTGQDVLVSIALKPRPAFAFRALNRPQGKRTTVQTTGRHDPCVGIRATPIAEAMLACVLMDHALRHRAQCADVQPLPSRSGKAR